MTAIITAPSAPAADVERLVAELLAFLETGVLAERLFAADVFADVSLPHWREQAGDRDALVAIRREGHASPGRVVRHRVDPIPTGFVIEFEEHWVQGGQAWRAREMIRADVRDGSIAELSVYCTGDWDEARVNEHAATVTLIRP
ncbi:MAG TPA: hypothetical protein VHE83_08880 [Mycobacteriales bacterium]|nr:hypothetical protein [Mycobacteriales bacterium]